MKLCNFVLGFMFLTACSTLGLNNDRRTEYDDYLNSHLKVQRHFEELRETGIAKILEVTPRLTELQATVTPGFELRAADTQSLWIVSLELPNWIRFSIDDFKFYWGEEPAKKIKEISDIHLIESLYPFAVPHDRIFIVEFSKSEIRPQTLKLQTTQGQFTFETP